MSIPYFKLLLLATLVGCAATQHAGLFTDLTPGVADALAQDTAEKLGDQLHTSAAIRVMPGDDAFGRALEDALRQHGYAVGQGAGGDEVSYAVDTLKGTRLLRMHLTAGEQRLTRAYALRGDRLVPAGPWAIGGQP